MATSLLSGFTCAVTGWMFVMYLLLRHPGYQLRAVTAAVIFAGAATLLPGRPLRRLRVPTALWGAAVALAGGLALASPGDDGWVIIAGTLFIAEGITAFAASISSASVVRRNWS